MSEFYVVAVCHTNRWHNHITLWQPDNKGYTPVIERAGKYTLDDIQAHMDYYNCGNHIALPCAVLDAMTSTVPKGYYDYPGDAIPNTRENWEAILAALPFKTRYKIRPDWSGKRGRRPQ